MKRILAPSILSADFKILGEQLKLCEESGAEYIHFDVMDGKFVPGISFGMPVLKSIKGCTRHVMDVHLMVTGPSRYIEAFQEAGADILTVHYEACEDLQAAIDKIHQCGMKAGIAIKPETPVEVLKPYFGQAESFLIMCVEPGSGGQPFIPYSLEKIRQLRTALTDNGLSSDIGVDGGIKLSNVQEVLEAGANIIIAGSAVFEGNIGENIQGFMEIFKEDE